MEKNPLDQYGVSHHLFEEIGYKLTTCHARVSVREAGGVVGAQYDGDIAGIPLTWRNVRDGSNGYYWTVAIVGEGWKLSCAMSMAPPQGTASGEDFAKIALYTDGDLRYRYIFRPVFTGDLDKMHRNLSIVRLFLD